MRPPEHSSAEVGETQLAALAGMVAHQRELLTTSDDERRGSRLDLEFHTFIRDAAASRPLSEGLSRLDAQAHLFRSERWTPDRSRRIAADEHGAILDALEAGDAGRAARVTGLAVRPGRHT